MTKLFRTVLCPFFFLFFFLLFFFLFFFFSYIIFLFLRFLWCDREFGRSTTLFQINLYISVVSFSCQNPFMYFFIWNFSDTVRRPLLWLEKVRMKIVLNYGDTGKIRFFTSCTVTCRYWPWWPCLYIASFACLCGAHKSWCRINCPELVILIKRENTSVCKNNIDQWNCLAQQEFAWIADFCFLRRKVCVHCLIFVLLTSGWSDN